MLCQMARGVDQPARVAQEEACHSPCHGLERVLVVGQYLDHDQSTACTDCKLGGQDRVKSSAGKEASRRGRSNALASCSPHRTFFSGAAQDCHCSSCETARPQLGGTYCQTLTEGACRGGHAVQGDAMVEMEAIPDLLGVASTRSSRSAPSSIQDSALGRSGVRAVRRRVRRRHCIEHGVACRCSAPHFVESGRCLCCRLCLSSRRV
jgi:hypothetical protein